MLRKEVLLAIMVIAICLVPLGSAAKDAPSCTSDKTKEPALYELLIHPAYLGAKKRGAYDKSEEEFEKEYRAGANFSYSNGVLILSPKEYPNQKMRVSLLNPRTIKKTKETGKYECAAEVTIEAFDDKGHSKVLVDKQAVTYTSELTDNGKRHLVTTGFGSPGSQILGKAPADLKVSVEEWFKTDPQFKNCRDMTIACTRAGQVSRADQLNGITDRAYVGMSYDCQDLSGKYHDVQKLVLLHKDNNGKWTTDAQDYVGIDLNRCTGM